MKTAWRRLGRTDAINWIVIVAVASIAFIGSFVGANFRAQDNQILFGLVNAISVLSSVFVLSIGMVLQRKITNIQLRATTTLLVLQVSALIRAAIFAELLYALGFTPYSDLLWRILGAESNIFIAGLVTVSFVAMARDFSERNDVLAQSLADLRASQNDLAERMTLRRANLVRVIKNQLNAGLANVTGTNLGDDARHLRTLIDEVVRPISHQLGREFVSDGHTPQPFKSTRINWRRVLSVALTENPVHPDRKSVV